MQEIPAKTHSCWIIQYMVYRTCLGGERFQVNLTWTQHQRVCVLHTDGV